jgi:hypothetical protein
MRLIYDLLLKIKFVKVSKKYDKAVGRDCVNVTSFCVYVLKHCCSLTFYFCAVYMSAVNATNGVKHSHSGPDRPHKDQLLTSTSPHASQARPASHSATNSPRFHHK